jgi:hypothetical protein
LHARAHTQAIINVDISYIETAAATICKNDPSIIMVTGELVTDWCAPDNGGPSPAHSVVHEKALLCTTTTLSWQTSHITRSLTFIWCWAQLHFALAAGTVARRRHLDGLMDTVNSDLQMKGQLTIGKLATDHGLPMDLMKEVVLRNMGGKIQGTVQGSTMYTDNYIAQQTARVRGAFGACTMPTSISEVTKRFGFDDKMVHGILEALVAGGQLPGQCQGAVNYTPEKFAETQADELKSFFSENGYMEIKRAKKLDVKDPMKLLAQFDPGCVQLSTLVAGGALVTQFEGGIQDAVANGSWANMAEGLPDAFTETDVHKLLTASKEAAGKKLLVLAGKYAVTSPFMARFSAVFQAAADAAAAQVRGTLTTL